MKQITLFRQQKRKVHSNRKGGIEGLPLQLLIIIVIAGLGLTLMVGWMNSISEPDRIDSIETSYERSSGGYEITVRVTDQNGDGVEGADVVLTGYGAYAYGDSVNTTDYVYVKNPVYINGRSVTGPVLRSDLTKAGYNANNYESYDMVLKGTEKVTPHGITDGEGYATIVVHFDNLKNYGTVNIDASKSGYSEMTTTMKVFA